MTSLIGALIGFYIAFNWRRIWRTFVRATNRERYTFGVLCFTLSLCVFLWRLAL